MQILLGMILGILLCIFITCIFLLFRSEVERTVEKAVRAIESSSGASKGTIYIPPSEADEARSNIVDRNREKGRDTKLSELI